jgi:hypothetical protein
VTEPEELFTVVVRGFGYGITHRAAVPVAALEPMAWPSAAYPFTGVRTPVVALCGRRVRSVQRAVVVMKSDRVSCCCCRRITEPGPASLVPGPRAKKS